MATLIRLRDPETGKSEVIDPKQYDVPAMLKAGYTRAGDVMVAAHSRAVPRRKLTLGGQLADEKATQTQTQTLTPAELAATGASQPPITPGPIQQQNDFQLSQPVQTFPPQHANASQVGGALGMMLAPEVTLPLAAKQAVTEAAPAIASLLNALPGVATRAASAFSGSLGLSEANNAVGSLGGTEPQSQQDQVDAAKQQALMSLLGDTAVGGARVLPVVGRAAMELAGKLTPDAAKVAAQEGITATKAGVAALKGKIEQAVGTVNRILQRGNNLGNRVPAEGFINEVHSGLRAQSAGNRLPVGDTQEQVYSYLRDAFLRRNPGPEPTIQPPDVMYNQKLLSGGAAPGAAAGVPRLQEGAESMLSRGYRRAGELPPGPDNVVSSSYGPLPDINPGGSRELTLHEVDRIVRDADQISKPLQVQQREAARGLGAPPLTDVQSGTMQFYKAVADHGRLLLRNLTKDITEVHPTRGPLGLQDAKALVGNLKELRDAFAPIVEKTPSATAQVMRGVVPAVAGGAAGAGVGALLPGNRFKNAAEGAVVGAAGAGGVGATMNPATLSKLAIALQNPAAADALVRLAPWLVSGAVQEQR